MGLNRVTSILLFSLSTLLLIYGCTSFQFKREVIGNTFVSSIPKITMHVSNEFKYEGEIKKHGTEMSVSYIPVDTHHNTFSFVEAEGDVFKRGLVIQFREVSTSFVEDIYGNPKNTIERGIIELGSKEFQFLSGVMLIKASTKSTRILSSQSYHGPCGLILLAGRTMSAGGDLLVQLQYYESLDTNSFTCQGWESFDELSENQILRYQEFKKRFESSFDLSFE